MKTIFIWNFVAGEILDQLVDWIYGQLVGFLGNFFALMGNMGVELFELEYRLKRGKTSHAPAKGAV